MKEEKKGKDRDLTIYPIKIDEDKLGEDDSAYPLPNRVHFNVLLGSIRSGKSTLLNSLYLSPRFMGGDMYQVKILISSTAKNDVQMVHMIEHFDYVFEDYTDTLLTEILTMIENDNEDRHYLMVVDDAMAENGITQKKAGKPDKFTQLITRYRHVGSNVLQTEGRLSIAVALQFFKYLTPTLRNQIQGLFLLGAFSESEIKKIAEAFSFIGGSTKEFLRLFNETRKEDYDFSYINVPRLEMYRNFNELVYSKNLSMLNDIDGGSEEDEDVSEPIESKSGKGKEEGRIISTEPKTKGRKKKKN